jgi:hypothetical protein
MFQEQLVQQDRKEPLDRKATLVRKVLQELLLP